VLWTSAGVQVVYQLLWQLYGTETVWWNGPSLEIDRAVLGTRWRRSYALSRITRVRTYPPSLGKESLKVITRMSVAFDCGIRTVRFGSRLNEAECRAISQALSKWGNSKRGGDGG